MDANVTGGLTDRVSAGGLIGGGAVGSFVVLSALAAVYRPGLWKLLGIAWVAFFAMALAIPLGITRAAASNARALVWGYGLASGAMVTSAAVFLLPQALGHHQAFGGFGVAAGLVVGYAGHVVGHRIGHAKPLDHTAVALSAHAFSAGAIIGVVYGNMPELGLVLGLAIVSHKGPAGYAAAKRLAGRGKPVSVLLLPAAGVGIAGLIAAFVQLPPNPMMQGVVFGFATGVFLHVGMDFLPECEVGGEIHSMAELDAAAHRILDRLRLHAVGATLTGGLAVFLAWLAIAA